MNPGGYQRRIWLGTSLGAVAALSAWLLRPNAKPSFPDSESAFWLGQFEQLDGTLLQLDRFKNKPLVLNFWATWCPPCVEELPLLNNFYQENAANGWQVLGLAVDQRAAVARFLGAHSLTFPVALAGLQGIELSKSLGNLSSGLPFTAVISPAGKVVHRKMGRLNPNDLVAIKTISN